MAGAEIRLEVKLARWYKPVLWLLLLSLRPRLIDARTALGLSRWLSARALFCRAGGEWRRFDAV